MGWRGGFGCGGAVVGKRVPDNSLLKDLGAKTNRRFLFTIIAIAVLVECVFAFAILL